MSSRPLDKFEAETGLRFVCKELLREAFVHSSYANEANLGGIPLADNERLEFLGDAVLEFVVSKHLFEVFPELKEGELTRLRAALVRGETLARLARANQMGDFLILGRGEEESGGRERKATLAATFEAVVGALFLDQGLQAVEKFVMPDLMTVLDGVRRRTAGKDAKSHLQEWTQGEFGAAPRYRVVESEGPDHDKMFVTEVTVLGHRCGVGRGRSKQEASQAAANQALALLGQASLAGVVEDEELAERWPIEEDVGQRLYEELSDRR